MNTEKKESLNNCVRYVGVNLPEHVMDAIADIFDIAKNKTINFEELNKIKADFEVKEKEFREDRLSVCLNNIFSFTEEGKKNPELDKLDLEKPAITNKVSHKPNEVGKESEAPEETENKEE